ncbi:hypothetical protein [Thiohalophilus thiocyanatoxydans]|uniref:Lipoprotein n=1 Tax=Thiohalophilus thiocyanatoxydans TaxID=381308 RepID=A0A4R8ITM9_9GAMM|nr:hypothetical protein [Thiohalophilus thiocyanatoxydans]TDY04356.1 hypothetical protein EDC23_0731 [Thiohalophilus thiocyanatoxydans]
MNKSILLVIFAAIVSVACTESGSGSDSPVTVNSSGNTYVNGFFGMSVEKPDDWYAQSSEEAIMLQQQDGKILSADGENMEAMIEAAMESTLPLFGFFKKPPGTPGTINTNVLSVAENIKMYPDIEKPCDYINAMKEVLEQGQLDYQFDSDCQTTRLGGKVSGHMDASLTVANHDVSQSYYALINKGYAISFIQTYADEQGAKNVAYIMDSIRFDP